MPKKNPHIVRRLEEMETGKGKHVTPDKKKIHVVKNDFHIVENDAHGKKKKRSND